MLTLGQQKFGAAALAATIVLVVAAVGFTFLIPTLATWTLLAAAGMALLVYWAIKWEITLWAWIWVLSYGMLDRPLWLLEIPGFFNMTIPRFMFIAATFAFVIHFIWRKDTVRMDRPVLWMMLVMLLICGASASVYGWVAEQGELPTAPYFRFLEPMLFPYMIFFLVYNSTRREQQITWAMILLTVYGWYALYIGYLQYAAIMGWEGARQFIFPSYINLPSWGPTYGIHFDRARGAFTLSNPQATLLILLFFTDLFLIRRLHGAYKGALIIQAILIPPAIFFTGLRSAYLAFLIAGAVWLLTADRQRLGKSKLALAVLTAVMVVAMFWTNLATQERSTGGVAQMETITGRMVLAECSWNIFKQHPLWGAGFGHYIEAEHQLENDTAELTQLGTGLATPHNLFLMMMAETGLFGMLAMAAVLLLLLRESIQLYRKLPESAIGMLSRPYVAVYWTAFTAYFVDAMLVDPLWDPASNALFWTFSGLMVGFNRLLDPAPLNLPATANA